MRAILAKYAFLNEFVQYTVFTQLKVHSGYIFQHCSFNFEVILSIFGQLRNKRHAINFCAILKHLIEKVLSYNKHYVNGWFVWRRLKNGAQPKKEL